MSECKNCYGTGHGNGGLSLYLDCTRCEVATIRARLNDKFPLAAKLYPDSLWGAYNEGKAAALPQWIACADRLPEVLPGRHTKCLMVWCEEIKCQFTASFQSTEYADGSENFVWIAFGPGGGSRITGVTHWREMSNGPAPEGGK